MYEVRGRPLLRCLVAPLTGYMALPGIAAIVLLFVGGWITVAAASFLLLCAVGSYRMTLRAGTNGLYVRNFVLRHRIPWADVDAVWAPDKARAYESLLPLVVIERRRGRLFGTAAYVTTGMRREERRRVARDLVGLGCERGYEIVGGAEAELVSQVAARERRTEP